MRMAIRKHCEDFVAVIVLLVIAARRRRLHPLQPAPLPAEWVPLVGHGLLQAQGRVPDRPGGHPGPGPDASTSPACKVGEITKVELEERPRGRDDEDQAQVRARSTSDATMLLRPKTGLKDMIIELDPGHAASRASAGQRHDPGRPDAARHQPRRDPRPLDADTRDYLRRPARRRAGRGSRTTAGPSRPRSGASSRRRATVCSDHDAAGGAPARTSLASIHNFSLLVPGAGRQATTSSRAASTASNAVFRALRRPGREPPGDAPAAAADAPDDVRPRWPRPIAWPGCSARRSQALRPAARALGPALQRGAPVPARDDADHQEPAPAVHPGRAAVVKDLRPAAQNLSALTPDLTTASSVLNYARQRAGLQPARRRRGGLPVLAVVGQPRRRLDLLHAGRARPDPPRPDRRQLHLAGLLDRSVGDQPPARGRPANPPLHGSPTQARRSSGQHSRRAGRPRTAARTREPASRCAVTAPPRPAEPRAEV